MREGLTVLVAVGEFVSDGFAVGVERSVAVSATSVEFVGSELPVAAIVPVGKAVSDDS